MIHINCPICKRGGWVIKYGGYGSRGAYRHRYRCKRCGRTFVVDYGYKWLHYRPAKVRAALELYAKGLTLREIATFIGCSASTVWRWIMRYAQKLYAYVKRFRPERVFQLHVDELFLRMKKRFFYVFDAIDKASRFAVFSVQSARNTENAKQLFREAPRAEFIVSDGLHAYREALKKFYHYKWLRSHYYRWHRFRDKHNNNIVERLQGTLRRWLHPKRGFKSLITAGIMLRFFYVYYNFIREHSSIASTPAEKAGVVQKEKLRNWKVLIRKAYFLILLPTKFRTEPLLGIDIHQMELKLKVNNI